MKKEEHGNNPKSPLSRFFFKTGKIRGEPRGIVTSWRKKRKLLTALECNEQRISYHLEKLWMAGSHGGKRCGRANAISFYRRIIDRLSSYCINSTYKYDKAGSRRHMTHDTHACTHPKKNHNPWLPPVLKLSEKKRRFSSHSLSARPDR